MPTRKITEQQVATMWATFRKRYRAKLKNKAKSPLMSVVGRIMGRWGPMSRADFMDRWTTVKRVIYYPAGVRIGHGDLGELIDQIRTCAHEFTHVIQGPGVKYLFSPARVAVLETDAYAAEMEIYHWLTGDIIPTSKLTAWLKDYGCDAEHLEYAAKKYSRIAKMTRRGLYRSETAKLAIQILERA